jgi:hypothetical protein
MTDGIGIIVWTAGAVLGLVTVAFLGAALVPAFVFHQQRYAHVRANRSHVQNGRVFCRVEGADIDVDDCVGCAHLRLFDGSGKFIVCDGRRPAAVKGDQ